jgi:hypothetical protein
MELLNSPPVVVRLVLLKKSNTMEHLNSPPVVVGLVLLKQE